VCLDYSVTIDLVKCDSINGSSDGICLCEPAANVPKVVTIDGQAYAVTASPATSKHKIQKHSQRPGGIAVPKNIAQAIATDLGSGNESAPWLNASYEGEVSVNGIADHSIAEPENGFGAEKDEIGWQGGWPDLHDGQTQDVQESKAVVKDCCSNNSTLPQAQPVPKSCCATGQTPQSLNHDDQKLKFSQAEVVSPAVFYKANDSSIGASQLSSWPQNSGIIPQDTIYSAGFSYILDPRRHASQGSSKAFPNHQTNPCHPTRPSYVTSLRTLSTSSESISSHNHSLHKCGCGDLCQCLGCPTHPGNDTTKIRMQELDKILNLAHSEDDSERSNSRPQSAYGGTTAWNPDLRILPPATYISDPSTFSLNLAKGTEYFDGYMTSGEHLMNQNDRSEVNMGGMGGWCNQVVMRPSAYIDVEYPFESWNAGCTDIPGSCHCGDDCVCTGCLTHSGHNGVSVGPPDVIPEQNFMNEDINAHGLSLPSATRNSMTSPQYRQAMISSGGNLFSNTNGNQFNYGSFGYGTRAKSNHHI
jgi:hypothetical protein